MIFDDALGGQVVEQAQQTEGDQGKNSQLNRWLGEIKIQPFQRECP